MEARLLGSLPFKPAPAEEKGRIPDQQGLHKQLMAGHARSRHVEEGVCPKAEGAQTIPGGGSGLSRRGGGSPYRRVYSLAGMIVVPWKRPGERV